MGGVILSWELNKARTWNVFRKIAATLHIDGHVFGPVDDEGGHPDRRDNSADINLAVHAHVCSYGGRARAESFETGKPRWKAGSLAREGTKNGTAPPLPQA